MLMLPKLLRPIHRSNWRFICSIIATVFILFPLLASNVFAKADNQTSTGELILSSGGGAG